MKKLIETMELYFMHVLLSILIIGGLGVIGEALATVEYFSINSFWRMIIPFIYGIVCCNLWKSLITKNPKSNNELKTDKNHISKR